MTANLKRFRNIKQHLPPPHSKTTITFQREVRKRHALNTIDKVEKARYHVPTILSTSVRAMYVRLVA